MQQPRCCDPRRGKEQDVDVDVVSRLLVKSTVGMKDNLLEIDSRGSACSTCTRVRAADLRFMDELMAVERGAVAPEVSAERKATGRRRKMALAAPHARRSRRS